MAQTVSLSCGDGVVFDPPSNTMICTALGPNEFVLDSGYPRLEAADIAALWSAALTVFAIAWGFNTLGHFLFPRR